MGHVQLRQVAFVGPWAGDAAPPTCVLHHGAQQAGPWATSDIGVGEWVVCAGEYTVSNSDMSAAASNQAFVQLHATVNASAYVNQELDSWAETAVAEVPVVPPPFTATVDTTTCQVPEAAGAELLGQRLCVGKGRAGSQLLTSSCLQPVC